MAKADGDVSISSLLLGSCKIGPTVPLQSSSDKDGRGQERDATSYASAEAGKQRLPRQPQARADDGKERRSPSQRKCWAEMEW